MRKFQITSKAGADFGVYDGETKEAAFASMVEDSGGARTDVDGRPTAGTVDDWYIAEVVSIGDWTGPMDAARALMDDDLCDAIHGTTDSEQDFADAYCTAHRAKYGTDFIVS